MSFNYDEYGIQVTLIYNPRVNMYVITFLRGYQSYTGNISPQVLERSQDEFDKVFVMIRDRALHKFGIKD